MPSERRGTVTEDVGGYIRRISGSSEWKGDKAGTIRSAVAKVISGRLPQRLILLILGPDGIPG